MRPSLLSVAVSLSLGVSPIAIAQAQAPSVPVPCTVTLDSLEARLRRNYAGYLLEVAPTRGQEYAALLERSRRAAAVAGLETSPCTAALREFIAWFDDPHLFLFQSTVADTAANRARERSLARDGRDEATLRAELERRRDSRDPLEGIWRDGALRVAVLRTAPGSDTLVAIVLASDTTAWPVGAIRARFVRRGEGSYTATLLARNFGQQELTATLYRRNILRFSPGMWGREYPLEASDTPVAPDADPRRPRLSVRARSVVLAIPSHDGPYQRVIDSLVSANRAAMLNTPLIIVDLRGNEGGGSQATRALHPFLVSAERRPTPYDEGRAMILSSPQQIDYVRRLGGERPSAEVQRLIARMEQAPGRLVPVSETDTPGLPSATPLDGAWRVAVLTDRGTISAAEVTVLMALRSTRATTIGEPTAGALDYQSTSIVGLGTGDRRWGLGYPTITAHADLPARRMRGRGIAPQIPLQWTTVSDDYATVERLMLDERRPDR